MVMVQNRNMANEPGRNVQEFIQTVLSAVTNLQQDIQDLI
jgi:hypothetical protein